MRKQNRPITTLKLFYALLFLICLSVSSTDCFANVPIKLQITGTETFESFSCPSGGYTASLTGATSTGEYEWDISTATPYGEVVDSQGPYATIRFTSAPSASEGEVTVKILCKAYYMDGNQRKSESAHLNVTWRCPRLTYGINGNTEVLDGIEETYTAWVAVENQNPTIKYFWKKGESQGNGIEADPFTTTFNSEDGQNVTLYCDIKAGDIPLKAQTEIHVNAYAMSVERWDYSGYLDNGPPDKRKVIHTNSTTSDSETVYIHYNIDDDDESENRRKMGYDCDQEEFVRNEKDDDLCELKIEIFAQGPFSVDDLDKRITITTSKGLRLWRSQYRTGNDFLQNRDQTKTWPISSINGKTIYIEGVAYNSPETLTIAFGKITKTLKYKTCSVGDKTDQPNLKLRKETKESHENLVDCEWYVIRSENPTYNCIAFSVDPYLTTFKNVSYTNKYEIRNNMEIDPKYPYPFRVEPISYERISPPTGANDTSDNFWLLFSSTSSAKYFIAKLVTYFKNRNPEFKSYVKKTEQGFAISGYTGYFKANAISFYSSYYIAPNKDSHWSYYLTMNDFNINGTNKFSWIDVYAFFTSDVWKKNKKS